ncbi:2-C-methyl-D-erythritol 4-phosphate cytidylyltransferase [Candidatus Izimaplasma bacterium HR1]|jgi:2-C-methyl-D-erythritol 4-phosphate cytidylyltransferase|uniref:2-C-methyl-D-erythritol 4-phosphate cytidylyltransferase n=1 Tax=Candidatus Izimoplasma sp. HR1 TaxID=1541959 RepID=UPI0004F88328|nr:2-C-methyl-D-erythritol 4-phosphate cytidylyltransferase [Candidatus Izimaplasma bacterium HR1]
MKYTAIILAAGSGSRTGLDTNKVLIRINKKRVLEYSVEFFKKHKECDEIIIVSSERDYNFMFDEYKDVVDLIVHGGSTRQQSVYKGLVKAKNEYILIHDSARPYIVKDCIDRLLVNLKETNATTLAVLVKDSIVETCGNRLGKQLNRSELLAIQTPQAFKRELIIEAHEKAIKMGYFGTDDTSLISRFTDVTPSYVLGDYGSIKLTTKEDIEILKVIL